MVHDPSLGPIAFSGFGALAPKALTVSNNGQTLVAAVSAAAKVQVAGGSYKEPYTISQINLHWGRENTYGSDHTVNGRRFPLELHFVGYKGNSLKAALASSDRRSLTELAVFFGLGPANPALQALIDAGKALKAGERAPVNASINLADLIPQAASIEYVTYLGSLASPPCTENVHWNVFRNVLTVSTEQLSALRALLDKKGKPLESTFRFAQPLNKRRIRSSFPFVVRRDVLTVAQTPLGQAVAVPVTTLSAPAHGAPYATPFQPAGPSVVPVVSAPPADIPVKKYIVPADATRGAGSTSTTINVSPISDAPGAPQKVDSVVKVGVANMPSPPPVVALGPQAVPIVSNMHAGCGPECVVVTNYAETDAEVHAVKQEAENASFIEESATAAADPAEKYAPFQQDDRLTRKSKVYAPQLATILDKPLNSHLPLTPEQIRADKKVKKAIAESNSQLTKHVFDSHAVKHAPLIPPNTKEAQYIRGEGWSNNQHPIVTDRDPGTYMRPDRTWLTGKYAPRVRNFHPSLAPYHETEDKPEPVVPYNGPQWGFHLPPASTVFHHTPYEVQSTVTSMPDTNEAYVAPTGPLTRSAGSSMLPRHMYPARNYSAINMKSEGYRGFDWVKALPPKGVFVSPSFLDTASHVDGAFPGSSALAHAQELSQRHAELVALEKQRDASLLSLGEVVKTARGARDIDTLTSAYAAANAQLTAYHPHVMQLAAFQNYHFAQAPTYQPILPALSSHVRVVQGAREEALRKHIRAIAQKVDALAEAEREAGVLRTQLGHDIGALARTQIVINDVHKAVDTKAKALLETVDEISALRKDDERAHKSAHDVKPAATSREVAALAKELREVTAAREAEGARLNQLKNVRDQLAAKAKEIALVQKQEIAETQAAEGDATPAAAGSLDATLTDLLDRVRAETADAETNVKAAAPNKAEAATEAEAEAETTAAGDVSLIESFASLKKLRVAQDESLSAQSAKVSALASTRNQAAAAMETAKLAELKAQHAKTLEREQTALIELAALKEQAEQHKSEMAALKASVDVEKSELEAQRMSLIEKSAKVRDMANALRQKQAVRVRHAMREAAAQTGRISSALAELEATPASSLIEAEAKVNWRSGIEMMNKELTSAIENLTGVPSSSTEVDADIEELAHAAD